MSKKFATEIEFDPAKLKKFRDENFTRISTFPDLVDALVKNTLQSQGRKISLTDSLDKYLRISNSDVISLISLTSGRKTQYTRSLVKRNAHLLKDRLLIVFSQELQPEDEAERYLTMLMDIPGDEIEKLILKDPQEFTRRANEAGKMMNNLVTITDTIDIADMIPFVRYIQKERGDMPLGLIINDYFQLTGNDEKRNAWDQLEDTAKKTKKVNQSLGVPIINVSQVNRESAKQEILTLHSAKGSGGIENSSQIVLALELPDPRKIYPLPNDEKKDPSKQWKKYPFGKDQDEVMKHILESKGNIEVHKLSVLKQKKVYYGVPKPTCYIAFNKRNLTMEEWIPPSKREKAPIIEVPAGKKEEDELPF